MFTWWVTGTMAIACYTAAFVWTMELATGTHLEYKHFFKLKTYILS